MAVDEVTKLSNVGYNFGQVKISVLLVELKRSSVVLLDSTVYKFDEVLLLTPKLQQNKNALFRDSTLPFDN